MNVFLRIGLDFILRHEWAGGFFIQMRPWGFLFQELRCGPYGMLGLAETFMIKA